MPIMTLSVVAVLFAIGIGFTLIRTYDFPWTKSKYLFLGKSRSLKDYREKYPKKPKKEEIEITKIEFDTSQSLQNFAYHRLQQSSDLLDIPISSFHPSLLKGSFNFDVLDFPFLKFI